MAFKMDFVKLIPFAVLYACCSVAGLMLIKTAGASGIVLAGIRLNWKIALGLAIYLAGFCTFFFFVQNNNLSYVFPLFFGMNYVAVVLAATLALNEGAHINPYQWVGIAAVLLGIILMNMKPGGNG